MGFPFVVNMDKTGEALVNRVSDAVGGIFKPWQTTRTAKAEAEAKKILAVADLEITEIRERATRRMLLEEEKNQENIESVTAKAIPHLSEEAKPEELDEDFVRYLFEKARLVSNEEMQSVWAKILAGEANRAGSFSRRTVEVVAQMDKEDAELFTRFCRSIWIIGGLVPIVLRTDGGRSNDKFSLSFSELQHLDDIGLIVFENISGFRKLKIPQTFRADYYGCPVDLHFVGKENNRLEVGVAIMTTTGIELAMIAGPVSSLEAFETGVHYFMGQNVGVSIPIDAKDKYLDL
ncbi:DUF2806 domain-containing protein [Rhizobium sp. LEGMi198b]